MRKKLSIITLSLGVITMMLSSVMPASAATQYGPEDVRTVNSSEVVTLYGQLLGVGNTTPPGSFNIRVDDTTDYVIYFDKLTVFSGADDRGIGPDWFLPGDWIRVIGTMNPDALSVDADVVVNTSVRVVGTQNINGFIQSIDSNNNQVTMEWNQRIFRLDFTENSRLVINGDFDASVSDLRVGDRVRGRGIKHATLDIIQVRLMVVLRRGVKEWVRNNTEVVRGQLLSITTAGSASWGVPSGTIAVLKIRDQARNIDFIVYTTEDTKFFRRWFGLSSLDDLIEGDFLAVIGKRTTNDSEKLTAHIIRNHSLGMVSTKGIPGRIVKINVAANNFILKRLGVLWRIDLDELTHLVLVSPSEIKNPASLSDLEVGDTCRGRGLRHSALNIVLARQAVCRR